MFNRKKKERKREVDPFCLCPWGRRKRVPYFCVRYLSVFQESAKDMIEGQSERERERERKGGEKEGVGGRESHYLFIHIFMLI